MAHLVGGRFFFWISKNDIYTNGYSLHEKHRADPGNTRTKTKRKQKSNPDNILITKEKESKEKKGENH